jgi:diguanylate cyclase (GGDEF)-like protein
MERTDTNVGYALLDEGGNLIATDEFFGGWLGVRTLVELLPELRLNDGATGCQRIQLCFAELESTLAEVEWRRLTGQGIASTLLRIDISGHQEVIPEYHDVVTGLPDRRALAAHRGNLLRSENGKLPHAVLFLDLENFKQVNDSYGHASGDQVLAIVAERWRKSLRSRDLIVRYGGDEFVVLVAGVHSRADVQPIVDRLRAVTNAPIQIDGHLLKIGVTIGVAIAEDVTTPLEVLLDTADRAMYASRRQTE